LHVILDSVYSVVQCTCVIYMMCPTSVGSVWNLHEKSGRIRFPCLQEKKSLFRMLNVQYNTIFLFRLGQKPLVRNSF